MLTDPFPAQNRSRSVAIAVAGILLGASALWAAPPGSRPDELSVELGLWLGWWLAALTGLRAAVALVATSAVAQGTAPARDRAGRWCLLLAPWFVRPLVIAALWATVPTPSAMAQEGPEPPAEFAVMRRVDGSGSPDAPVVVDIAAPPATVPPTDPGPQDTDLTVEVGDHLWGLAQERLTHHLGRPPRLAELHEYWLRVVEANLPYLRSADPNLIHPGEEIVLPAPWLGG
ncbi:MAG: hypothetical protein GY745_00205 [Actinomycetia bacterium]|nr:hypothetical protein [Actinomycetes bacterium]MCP4083469.1 hypothetical protein [Actinomycetes bacterium]